MGEHCACCGLNDDQVNNDDDNSTHYPHGLSGPMVCGKCVDHWKGRELKEDNTCTSKR